MTILTHIHMIWSTNVDFIDEVELDVVPLVVCGVVFRSPYMDMWNVIFMKGAN